jgi:hemerythrin
MQDADDVVALVAQLRPLLASKPSEIQGAALADLLSIWLAGHVIRGDHKATKRLRDKVLNIHIEIVRRLIPISFKMCIEPHLRPDA